MQVKHLLSEDECRKLIELSEEVGLEPLCGALLPLLTKEPIVVVSAIIVESCTFIRRTRKIVSNE